MSPEKIWVVGGLLDGGYVHFGIGGLSLVTDHIPYGELVTLHSENRLFKIDAYASEEQVDAELISFGQGKGGHQRLNCSLR